MTTQFRYLLDTNILSDLVKNPQGAVTSRISAVGEETICTSIIVAAELLFGAEKSNSEKLAERVNLILTTIEILPLESPAEREYAGLRNYLFRKGTPIGPNDMIIAAHALAKGLIIVTANNGEFSRVPGLEIENWLAE